MKVATRWHGETRIVDVPERLTQLANESSLFDAASAEWMVSIIADAMQVNEYPARLASTIKTFPPLLTAADKRERGLNARVKLGAAFADCLTDAGKVDPASTAMRIARAFLDEMNDWHRREMTPTAQNGLDLFLRFVARQQGCAIDQVRAIEGSADDAMKLMWHWQHAMHDAASADGAVETLRAMGYDAGGEAEVDAMLEQIAESDGGVFELKTNAAIGVLTERVRQAMMILLANAGAGVPTILPPADMNENRRQFAIGLLWLYRAELPFPPPPPLSVPAPIAKTDAGNSVALLLWMAVAMVIVLFLAAR